MTPIVLESPAFKPAAVIPAMHTCDAGDASPILRWAEGPAGTRCWVLLCEDPDAPSKMWVHWVLYNLPAEVHELAPGLSGSARLANGGLQGLNDFGRLGYGGPCPPRGAAHRYFFRLYALDRMLDLPSGATHAQVLGQMEGHVLGRGELMGLYSRR